jgi:RNA polymerase sigma-70 factor (ECF subfamily)
VPLPPPSPDSLVIRAILAGDAESFRILVERHHAHCLRIATHLLDDPDEAEDAVQDSFVRAFRHLPAYREQDRFRAWLLRIVVNQCRTRAAKSQRFVSFDAERHEVRDPEDHDAPRQLDRRADLATALAQLPAEQREIVVLRFAEDLSYEEIAALTGVGVSALKMRVQRAITRLRALFASHLSE